MFQFQQILLDSETLNEHAGVMPRLWVIDGGFISIQAGGINYSSPRDVIQIDQYESYELAFFDDIHRDCHPEALGLSQELRNRLAVYDDGSGMYGWVPAELVDEITQAIVNFEKNPSC